MNATGSDTKARLKRQKTSANIALAHAAIYQPDIFLFYHSESILMIETRIVRWLIRALIVAGIMGTALILYLSWIPDSRMNNVRWMPLWLGTWADDGHENSRTILPFVFLGFVTGGMLALSRSLDLAQWVAAWGILLAVAIVAELGQILIRTRGFSFADVSWGSLGAGAGLALVWFLCRAANKITPSDVPSSGGPNLG